VAAHIHFLGINMNETEFLSVGEVSRRIGARPQDVTTAFYRGLLRDDLCPLVGGRRLIPESYVDLIAMALKRAGKLAQEVGHDVE